jgi:hypothetical protein
MPGELCGRGIVETSSTCVRIPHGWAGGVAVLRVALDHGPRVWAFAESLRRAPVDTYERAWAAPVPFFDVLLARSPLERARALRFLALRSGGDLRVRADGGLEVAIPSRATWMFGLLRRLPVDRAIPIGLALVEGWLSDAEARTRRFGVPVAGTEISGDDVIEPYQFEIECPLELVLGGLTLLVAERRVGIPPVPALHDPSAIGLGSPPDAWHARVAYLVAACEPSPPPPLPDFLLHGYPVTFDRARALGLDGAGLVEPSELDRLRP